MTIMKSIAAAALVSGLLSSAAFAQEVTLKIAAASPSTGNVCKGYLDVWAEKIKAESNGRIDYQLFCDNTLTKFGDAVDRVAAGVADIAWALPAAYGQRFAGLNVIGVPGLYTDPRIASGALWKTYEAGHLGEITDVRVLWFQAVNNNTFWLKKKPDSHENLKDVKIGMGSQIRAAVVEAAGGIPISLKVPEYYQSIAKGAADGVMTTGGAVQAYSIQEVTDYYMEGPFGGGMTFTVMNNDTYNSLPDDLKKIIDDNSGYETSVWAADYLAVVEEEAMEQFLEREGTQRYQLTPEEIAAWEPVFKHAEEVWLGTTEGGTEYLAKFREHLDKEMKLN